MNQSRSFSAFKIRGQRMVVETALVFAGAMILPFLVHLAPNQGGTPIGALWLPMFYAPLIAALLLKPEAGFVAGVLVPLVNGLMTSSPAGMLMWSLSFEIGVFVLATYALNKYVKMRRWAWLSGLGGYLITKTLSITLLSLIGQPFMQGWKAFLVAWPGMLMFVIIGYVTIKWRENRY